MRSRIFVIIFLLIKFNLSFAQNPFIIDHSFAKLDSLKTIPIAWINYARKYLHIRYEHSSHGGQIITGMQNLDAFMGGNGLFTFGSGEDGKLDIDDLFRCDLSTCSENWDDQTRAYLDDPNHANCNVVIWSWCNIVGTNATDTSENGYIGRMEKLIAEYGPEGSKINDGSRTVQVSFVFMTGHVNADNGETQLINAVIRKHCKQYNRYLFDFADIESWNPDNVSFLNSNVNDNCDYENSDGSTGNWAQEWIAGKKGMSSPTDFSNSESQGGKWYQCKSSHSQPLSANLKAYGAWYLFARIAGWSFGPTVPVDTVTVHGLNNVNTIQTDQGKLQMVVDILPHNASNKYMNWSIYSGSDLATISYTGILSAVKNGTVIVKAEADDGSGVWDTCSIDISNQIVHVSSILVSGENNVGSINIDKGTLQLLATINPADANNQSVTWSVQSGGNLASVNSSGLLTARNNGTVIVKATANDGSRVSGTFSVYISNQIVLINSIEVRGQSTNTISASLGTLQMEAILDPSDATNQDITWSIIDGSTFGSLNNTGEITAVKDGTMIIKGATNDGTKLWDTCKIYIVNQPIPVSSITIRSSNNSYIINSNGGTLQLVADIQPSNSSNKKVMWSIISGYNFGSIDLNGKLTAMKNGAVTVKATATDGSGIYSARNIDITNQSTSISELHAQILVFPNPTNGIITIKTPWPDSSNIEIDGLNGVMVFQKTILNTEEVLETNQLKPGFYTLKIMHDHVVYFSKLVKQ